MISGFVKDSFMNVAIWLSLFKYCRIEFSCDYWYMIKCLYSFRLIYFYSYNLVGLYLVIYKFCLRNVVYNVLFEWFHLHTKNSMLLSNPFIAVLLQLNCRLSTVLSLNWSADGSTLFSGYTDGVVRVWGIGRF
jgi:WD40 repeat protein